MDAVTEMNLVLERLRMLAGRIERGEQARKDRDALFVEWYGTLPGAVMADAANVTRTRPYQIHKEYISVSDD